MGLAVALSLETGDTLTDAYMVLKNTQDGPGKKEQGLDNFENAVASTNDSTLLNNLYDTNHSLISSAAAGFSSLDGKAIDHAITSFSESVKVVMRGLDALEKVHPFISVAVLAFKLVVTFDLTRRENNQKVLAVKIQMQQMMCTLFQLRRVKDPDALLPDGKTLKGNLQPLMQQIANDIKHCASVCDVYLKKSFVCRTLKSPFYEPRLTGFIETFRDHQDNLDKTLSVHIALGVDSANEKLDAQSSLLQSIRTEVKLLFRKLDTPREREVQDFIDENGGPESVVERDDLIEKLLKKSGETMEKLTKGTTSRSQSKNDAHSVKETLKQELAEDLNVVLQRNFVLFDRKLEIQDRNMKEAFEKHDHYITTFLSSGPHDKIKDVDMRSVWKEMGWKGSVKARHFALALRDYFTGQFSVGSPFPRAGKAFERPAILISTPKTAAQSETPTVPSLPGLVDDHWALQYLDVAHLQSILEAIDDDGTGFISIKEANTFAREHPKGWSLLHRIAFWAKGWEISLADYKNKIFLILQEMDQLLEKILKENRCYVDNYLRHYAIAGIERALRSTKTAKEYSQVCPELVSLTKTFTDAEEKRLRKNLEKICYDMDTASTVTLITGPGRIERYLFPLLYLTLLRHLEVFHYACGHIVDSKEFSHMSTTLESIFDVVDQRIESLKAIYKQVHVDLSSHLKNFALGMFHDIFVDQSLYDAQESLILTWKDTSRTKDESDENRIIKDPKNAKPIFSFNPNFPNGYQDVWPHRKPHSFDTGPYTGTVLGSWTGYLQLTQEGGPIRVFGLTELSVEVDTEDHSVLKGSAITYFGKLEGIGRRRKPRFNARGYEEIDLVMSFEDGSSLRLVGKLGEKDEELFGQWKSFGEKKDAKLAYDTHPFGDAFPKKGATKGGYVALIEKEGKEGDSEGGGSIEENASGGGSGDQTEKIPEVQNNEKNLVDSEDRSVNGEDSKGLVDLTKESGAVATGRDVARAVGERGIVTDSRANDPNGNTIGKAGTTHDEVDDNPEDTGQTLNKDGAASNTFVFRRTPVEVVGFRHFLDEDKNKAKARWTFLRESVLHLIRQRLSSMNYLQARIADCNQFLNFYKRDWLLSSCDFATPNPLTEIERNAWNEMKYRLPPSIIRPFVEALDWSLDRLPFHYGIGCDGCQYRLIGERFVCLTCMDPKMSNSFDLCFGCKDKPAERDDFTHTTDHTLIKARQHIHRYIFTWLTNEAKLMTTRLKTTFKELLNTEGQGGYATKVRHMSAGGHSELLCGCCVKPVRIPCWVCIICAQETYLCMECEEKELPVKKSGPGCQIHRLDHPLLRLHNLGEEHFERQKIDPTVARINELESAVNRRLEVLGSSNESRITALEIKVEARLTSFESLLRRIALQLKVPEQEEPVDGDSHVSGVTFEGN